MLMCEKMKLICFRFRCKRISYLADMVGIGIKSKIKKGQTYQASLADTSDLELSKIEFYRGE